MQCSLFERCHEALQSLAIPSPFFNSSSDKCYCSNCYIDKTIYIRGGETYEMPIGACRFGLKISNKTSTDQEIFNKWLNSYHGTKSKFVKSIIENGLQVPGTIVQGKVIKIKEGHIPGKKHIYSSPSFAYCCASHYSNPYPFKGREYKFFIQIRQKPGSFNIRDQTLPKQIPDKYVNQNEMEYYTTDPDSIAQIGIIVFEVDPNLEQQIPKILLTETDKIVADQKTKAYKEVFLEIKSKFPNMEDILCNLFEVLNSIDSRKSDIDRIVSRVKSDKKRLRCLQNWHKFIQCFRNWVLFCWGCACWDSLWNY